MPHFIAQVFFFELSRSCCVPLSLANKRSHHVGSAAQGREIVSRAVSRRAFQVFIIHLGGESNASLSFIFLRVICSGRSMIFRSVGRCREPDVYLRLSINRFMHGSLITWSIARNTVLYMTSHNASNASSALCARLPLRSKSSATDHRENLEK